MMLLDAIVILFSYMFCFFVKEAKTDCEVGKGQSVGSEKAVAYPVTPKVQGSKLLEVCFWIGFK